MKIQRKQAIGENLLYLMVWSAIILVPVLNSQMMSEMHINLENVLIAWQQIAPYLIIFLIHNCVLAPRYMLRRKYGKYVLLNLALIIGVFWLVELYEEHLMLDIRPQDDAEAVDAYRKASFSNLEIYWNVILGFFMTGANTGIKLIYQSMRDEQQMEALKRQNLQAEMDYLKYQINPHFFMNTLNNIHALIDIDTETAKDTVIELSKMMRYILYNSDQDGISLEQEINFLGHYIRLMRLRYSNSVEIEMRTPEHVPHDIMLPPLVLIVFVENAFKHGISYNWRSFINIGIEVADRRIICTVTNSRNPSQWKKSRGGIGLDNVRKRLDLIYHDRYSLAIDQSEDTYSINLNIPSL